MANLLSKTKLTADTSYAAKTEAQEHEIDRDVPLSEVFDALVEYAFEDPRDTANFAGLLITIAEGIRQDPSATAAVYRMRPKATGERKLTNETTFAIDNFQQGATRTSESRYSYPGDGYFKSDDKVSLQVHTFDLTYDNQIVARSAPLITVRIPGPLAKAWLVQVQRGQTTT
jgi:hypothetical protein